MSGAPLRVLSLFAGIGGFDLGLERAGMKVVAQCEIDPFCRAVLKKHWPDVPCHEDIRTLKGEDVGPVDVICGGFPCQPFSAAGKRRGTADDRHLWPEMVRLVAELRPAWVLGENVAGLVSMVEWRGEPVVESRVGGRHAHGVDYESVLVRQETMLLHAVCEDLGALGYEVVPFVIPACAVDAPHRRDRVWVVAHAAGAGRRPAGRAGEAVSGAGAPERPAGCGGALADADEPGLAQRLRNAGMDRGTRGGPAGEDAALQGWWPPEPDVGRVASRVPNRVDRLRALGNAVVPQVVEQIGRAVVNTHTEPSHV